MVRRGRSWWTVTVNRREGVLNNKWYIGFGTGVWAESVTTSNSYIITVKDKKNRRKKRQESVSAVQVPRGVKTKGEEVE